LIHPLRMVDVAVSDRVSWKEGGKILFRAAQERGDSPALVLAYPRAARIAPFECVQSHFPKVPAPLHPYLEQCHFRARELNAIEAVFRYAACRIEMYLKHGTVTLGGCTPAGRGGGRQAFVAKQ
jgi:hypothetical protein